MTIATSYYAYRQLRYNTSKCVVLITMDIPGIYQISYSISYCLYHDNEVITIT